MAEVNRGYLDEIRRWSLPAPRRGRGVALRAFQLMLVPALLIVAATLTVGLRFRLRTRSHRAASLHEEAREHVDSLCAQYPLHLYPIVAKALELAYMKRQVDQIVDRDTRILEIAIGEGTLSARVFARRDARVGLIGLDLNPHSLVNAAKLRHVKRAIVGDGLQPPVAAGTADLVVSLNFLHHVTDKGSTLKNWTRIGGVVLFNENTPFWASGWTVPYVLKRLGLARTARSYADRIEQRSLQHLVDRSALESEFRAIAPILDEVSFVSERCFFLCSLFSFLMRCYGPPTPSVLKRLFLGPLRSIALPLTKQLAGLLLLMDEFQDRATDTFVFFKCAGVGRVDGGDDLRLVCPQCSSELTALKCVGCGTRFPEAEGMVFLLPAQFKHVYDDYVHRRNAKVPLEHL
jgi:ubiquinone/menaquinone biosynthesis C-methylase UbiE